LPRWLPSLYFAKGLSQVAVMSLAVILYKQLGLSNAAITFYVAWFYLPWVIKSLWKPFVDRTHNSRWWILLSQLLLGAGFGGVAFTIHAQFWLQGSLFLFWLVAFACATHNEAADHLYRKTGVGKTNHRVELVRQLSQKVAMALGQGVLVMLAGNLQVFYRNNIRYSWSLVFYIVAGIFLLLFLYHLHGQPFDENAQRQRVGFRQVWEETKNSWWSFLRKPSAGVFILFLLLYRLPEALMGKMSLLFLLDPMQGGGLGLAPQEYGLVMGTVGIIGLSLGGVFGAKVLHRDGANHWKWWMACAMTVPDLLYVYLSYALPDSLSLISACVCIEQFGYGFGIIFYLHCLGRFSRQSVGNSHRTIAKSIMALSMMLPTMIAGTLQMSWGYRTFFLVVIVLSAVTFWVTSLMPIERTGNKK
jgi:PAT family beta-lactamase induction signal transducer AmpG